MEWQRETIGIERIGGRAKIADYSGLGTGKTDHLVTGMGSKNIGKYFVAANISYFAIGQQDDSKHSRGEWTCAVSRPFKGSLSAVGEIYGDSRLDEMNVSFATSTWALTYRVNRKLVLDAGAVIGFTAGLGTPGNAALWESHTHLELCTGPTIFRPRVFNGCRRKSNRENIGTRSACRAPASPAFCGRSGTGSRPAAGT
jgi:hypothetical protein